MSKNYLFLMVGIPGAGKTTAAKIITAQTHAVHIWADHERRLIHKQPSYSTEENNELYVRLNSLADDLLSQGKSVVYDTAFNHRSDRRKLQTIASKHDARVVIIWVKAPKTLAKDRAQNTHNHAATRVLGDMSDEHFDHLSEKLEPPTADEYTIELDGTKLSQEYVGEKLARL